MKANTDIINNKTNIFSLFEIRANENNQTETKLEARPFMPSIKFNELISKVSPKIRSFIFTQIINTNVVETNQIIFQQRLVYTFFKKIGPQHKPIFKTEVEIPESKKIIGEGASKKKAQQNAAEKLIKLLNI